MQSWAGSSSPSGFRRPRNSSVTFTMRHDDDASRAIRLMALPVYLVG
jgi:hypothetical protein